MERKNGFLCIDNCRIESAHEHLKKTNHYWVWIDGEEYYFKPTEHCYNELIGYQAAMILGIDACFCDLATLNGQKGIISKSLRSKKTQLTSGFDILKEYAYGSLSNLYWIKKMMEKSYIRFWFDENYREKDNSIPESILHDLENIWHALDYKYSTDKRFDLEKVMNQVVKMFLFTLLSYDEDRFSFDWLIAESEDDINLAPLFDNEYAFNYNEAKIHQRYKFSCSTDSDSFKYHQLQAIERFFSISSSEYFGLFCDMHETLVANFENIIGRVECQIGTLIPADKKSIIVDGFYKNMEQIRGVIEKYETRKNK